MTDLHTSVSTIYEGWYTYQTRLIDSLAPLSPDQLALRVAPTLRSIGDTATHMISGRARWFYQIMNEGGDEFAGLSAWDGEGMPLRTASELVTGLEITWQGMQAAIARWTPDDWQQTYPGEGDNRPATITRHWVIWHLLEHDLHHGGEIGLTLSMYALPAPNL